MSEIEKPNQYILSRIDKEFTTINGVVYRNGREIGKKVKGRKRVGIKENGVPRNVYTSHIVWYKTTGEWPKLELHHKNELPGDDRFENLEEITHSQNCFESKRSRLPIGIDRQGNQFRVRVCKNSSIHYIGRFSTLEEAIQARRNSQCQKITTNVCG